MIREGRERAICGKEAELRRGENKCIAIEMTKEKEMEERVKRERERERER